MTTTRMEAYPRRRPIASLPVKNGEREGSRTALVMWPKVNIKTAVLSGNLPMSVTWLKNKGKDRGWSERVVTTHEGHIQIEATPSGLMSREEIRALSDDNLKRPRGL